MSATGHAKNVENWQKMIAACTGFGGDYQPSNVNLTVGSMTTLLPDVETEMDGVQTGIVPRKNKAREPAGVRPGTTQMLAASKMSAATGSRVDNMKTYRRQVHGAGPHSLAAGEIIFDNGTVLQV